MAALFTIARKWKQPIPINRGIDKEVVVHIYNGISLSHTKECIWVSFNEVDEPRAYYTEWSKWESEKQIYQHIYMKSRKMVLVNPFAGQRWRHRHRKQTCGHSGGGEGGTDWENSMETWITVCRVDSQWKFPVWCRELKPILCDNLEGGKVGSVREVQEVWDIFLHMAVSCWYVAEANTIF